MTSWNLDQRVRAKGFWEIALSYTNYDFEYKLAMVSGSKSLNMRWNLTVMGMIESQFGLDKSFRNQYS